jgi:hypothetical protein
VRNAQVPGALRDRRLGGQQLGWNQDIAQKDSVFKSETRPTLGGAVRSRFALSI